MYLLELARSIQDDKTRQVEVETRRRRLLARPDQAPPGIGPHAGGFRPSRRGPAGQGSMAGGSLPR